MWKSSSLCPWVFRSCIHTQPPKYFILSNRNTFSLQTLPRLDFPKWNQIPVSPQRIALYWYVMKRPVIGWPHLWPYFPNDLILLFLLLIQLTRKVTKRYINCTVLENKLFFLFCRLSPPTFFQHQYDDLVHIIGFTWLKSRQTQTRITGQIIPKQSITLYVKTNSDLSEWAFKIHFHIWKCLVNCKAEYKNKIFLS